MTRRTAQRVAYAIVTLGVLMGCAASTDVAPPSGAADGTLNGTVTLIGTEGPAQTTGHLSLYSSLDDFEIRRAAYDGPLTPIQTGARTFSFLFDVVRPGTYYVTACFAFGCGEYRDHERGDLVPVLVSARGTTRLDLSF